MTPDSDAARVRWRIGSHYGIHVYEGDVPIATFHAALDAKRAVDAVNGTATDASPEPADSDAPKGIRVQTPSVAPAEAAWREWIKGWVRATGRPADDLWSSDTVRAAFVAGRQSVLDDHPAVLRQEGLPTKDESNHARNAYVGSWRYGWPTFLAAPDRDGEGVANVAWDIGWDDCYRWVADRLEAGKS